MALFKTSSDFSDAVSILAFSPSDNSYMFTQDSPSSEYWIPSSRIQVGSSLSKQLVNDIIEIFGTSIVCDCLLRIYRFWLPNTQSHISHYVFAVKVDQEHKKRSKQTSGKFRGKINWILDHDLFRIFSMNNMRSPELFEMIMSWKNKTMFIIPEVFKSDAVLSVSNFTEMIDSVIINNASNAGESLVLTTPFTKQVQANLYREFLLGCFPSFYMGLQSFCKFFSNLGWTRGDQMDLFRAADVQGRFGLSFREFLYIAAAVEPNIESPSGNAGEMRSKFLFRFYDKDNDSLLKPDELKQIFLSIRKSMKHPIEQTALQKDLTDFYRSLQVPETTALSTQVFVKAVHESKIKNTSMIFRSPIGIISYLKEANDREARQMQTEMRKARVKPSVNVAPSESTRSGHTRTAGTIKYELGSHSVKIYTAGTMNIDKLATLDAVTPSSIERPIVDDVKRKVSIDQFSQDSITNELIKSLRYMNLVNKQNKAQKKGMQFTWGNIDSGLFAKRLITVSKLTTEILKNEPRLLQVSSPVYVLGDLHGNFNDLLHFESILWHVGPVLCPSNLLFLGDYVDRGSSSIEVISYLFSYKVQNPEKIKLVRGNHEIREVQKMFTFYTECQNKFGDRLGAEVWSAVNLTFDHLPVAAIIDNSIFCCHGGIPPPWLCPVVSCINEIPMPLNQPDEQSALAWEIMWNDPIRSRVVTDAMELELSANEGFAVNKRRGTAHMFSAEALDRFLRSNGFTHLIRAHEVSPAGFSVLQKGKLLTVFSSSKYCGGMNDAACIMVDQGRLRIMRIESD
ncbi:serine/threonine-protein phosphatase PPQ-like [Harmonia axyridis]|uniref:serine/threonine-protein phosphatase PPQ-like n=1 Tax=Harmonia axyridis TaxID=115357 RepID=UPI001E27826A|nr:serine/threonine-protein phosphatase PPQ-like [Harmonia axyridis]